MAHPPCLVCGRQQFAPHLDILLKCGECGFVTARLDQDLDALQLYRGNYFTGEEYLDYAADEAFFKRNFRKRLGHVLRYVPHGRLLEIGAAYGFFLDLAQQHFEVIGFEVNEEGARFGRDRFGVDIHTSDFLQTTAEQIGGQVDVTVMWDVIEHLQAPDQFIARIAQCSRPGAFLCITTGDISSLLARLRGRKWRMIHPPTHLHYFDRRTLPRLLERHGFQTIDIRPIGVARSIQQILYSLLVLGVRQPQVHERLKTLIPPQLGFTLNTFDIMQVTARLA